MRGNVGLVAKFCGATDGERILVVTFCGTHWGRELEMNTPSLSSSIVAREELEEAWRQKTLEAQERYHVATEHYNRLLEESQGLMPAADSRLMLARDAQSAALDEYTHVLRIFTEFTINDRVPEQESTKSEARP